MDGQRRQPNDGVFVSVRQRRVRFFCVADLLLLCFIAHVLRFVLMPCVCMNLRVFEGHRGGDCFERRETGAVPVALL